MPLSPGSSCVGIPPPLQAHLVLDKTNHGLRGISCYHLESHGKPYREDVDQRPIPRPTGKPKWRCLLRALRSLLYAGGLRRRSHDSGVKAAFINLGPFNPVVALVIATVKATLVVLFFMHVKGASEKLTAAVVCLRVFLPGHPVGLVDGRLFDAVLAVTAGSGFSGLMRQGVG